MHDRTLSGAQHAQAVARFRTIVNNLSLERSRQDAKFGEQNHSPQDWMMILQEELGEFARAHLELLYAKPPASVEGEIPWQAEMDAKRKHLREELVQIAAVAVAMLDCGDRNQWWPA